MHRILIVDDHPHFRASARALLEHRGYRVLHEVEDGASALDAVTRLTPDGVLLDLRLGADDGFAVCSSLLRERPALGVLLVSCDEPGEAQRRARAAGARGFVRKQDLMRTDLTAYWPH